MLAPELQPIIDDLALNNGLVLRLRILDVTDAEAYYRAVVNSKAHLATYNQATLDAYPDEESVKESIDDPNNRFRWRFGIWVCGFANNEEFAGSINASFNIVGNEAEIGYWLDKDHLKNGYARMAVSALVNYISKNYPHVRIFAKVVSGNTASENVLVSSGFVAKEYLEEPPRGADQLEPVQKRLYEYPITNT